MDDTTKTAEERICPICGYARGYNYAGEPQCRMSFGGSMRAWENSRADLVKRGCILLDDEAEQRGYEQGLEDAARALELARPPAIANKAAVAEIRARKPTI